MTDLKPCPMCNGNADILTNGDISYVFCVDCGCRTAFVQHESESIAVELWNRRIEPEKSLKEISDKINRIIKNCGNGYILSENFIDGLQYSLESIDEQLGDGNSWGIVMMHQKHLKEQGR